MDKFRLNKKTWRRMTTSVIAATLIFGLASAPVAAGTNDLFVDSGQLLGGTQKSLDVDLADFDGDGDLDALFMNASDPNQLWWNDGTGTFTDSGQQIYGSLMAAATTGDFNGDGHIDAFIVGESDTTLENNGSGVLNSTGNYPGVGGAAVDLADLDGDGDLDAYVGAHGASRIYFNNGNNSGIFTLSTQTSLNTDISVTDVDLVDLDDDGDNDAVLSNHTDNKNGVRIMINDGSGSFTSGATFTNSYSYSTAVEDIDNDGDSDIVTSHSNPSGGYIEVYLNNGSGSFTANPSVNVGGAASSDMELADFDRDGDLDAFFTAGSSASHIHLNDGTGTFSSAPVISLGASIFVDEIALGDLDGDGDIDAVTAVDTNSNRVYVNTTAVDISADQSINSSGQFGFEYFTIGTDEYMAEANFSSADYSKIYKWDGNSFIFNHYLAYDRAVQVTSFEIGGETYLALALYKAGSSYATNSVIYSWDDTTSKFVSHQTIPTKAANDVEHFSIDSGVNAGDYVVFANYYDTSGTWNQDSKVYKWNTTTLQFDLFDSLATHGATDWEPFAIGSEQFIAVSNYYNGTTYDNNSEIFKFTGTGIVSQQTIATHGAMDWDHFEMDGDDYLVAANYYPASNQDSDVYKWNSGTGQFDFQYDFATNGAHDIESFDKDGDSYIIVAQMYNGSSTNIDSKIFKMTSDQAIETNSFATGGATDVGIYTMIDGSVRFGISNYYDTTKTTIYLMD